MSDTAPIGPLQVTPPTRPSRLATVPRPDQQSGGVRGRDRVEFSQAAKLLSRLAQLPDVRQDLVERVRAEISAGTYESEDKIDALLEGLTEDLGLGGE